MQGKTISGYTLQRLLGTGGMAEVWYAENAIEKQAAVKLLLPKFCNDEAIVARFQNEAKVMVKLDHPNIRQVYDYGSIDGRPCIVMEYLEGDDLKALMKSGRRFTDAELRKWWNQIADALNYTHAKGIVHRDIKPSNIFLDTKGNIKLLDFGIAKIKESISMTQTGATMGTLMYMSPEQVDDAKHIGPQSDVYSLAVTFVHLLTGKAPYDTTNSSDYKIRKGIVEIPLDLTGIPADWQAFLALYLEKDPEKRPALRSFETMSLSEKPEKSQIDDDEGTIVAGGAPKTALPDDSTLASQTRHAPLSPAPTDKPKSKKGLWIGIGAAVIAAVLALVFLVPRGGDRASDNDTTDSTESEAPIVYTVETVPNTRLQDNSIHVSDPEGYLSDGIEKEINTTLCAIGDKADVFVVALPSIGDDNPDDFATRLANYWGIGDASKNNGVLLLFTEAQRSVVIRTGLGMSELLPNSSCERIIDQTMKPYFKAGDYEGGIYAGVKEIAAEIGAKDKNSSTSDGVSQNQEANSGGGLITPVHWSYEIKKRGPVEFDIVAKAKIDPEWYLFSTTMPEFGPLPMTFEIDPSVYFEAVGKAKDLTEGEWYYDDIFEVEYRRFRGNASYAQTFKILQKGVFSVTGVISGQACKEGLLLPVCEDIDLMYR